MKQFLYNFLLFALMAVAFSSITSCSADTTLVPAQRATSTPAGPASSAKSSGYPPIASAVAQADIKNLDGTTFKVAERKGKVLLLNLWATWCGPCRAEMPALVKMQDEYRGKGFEVIGLNADDETVEIINKFATSLNVNYQLAWADTNLQKELLKISQFGGIPQSFLIDRDGNLRGVFKGAGASEIKAMETLVGKVVNGEDTNTPEAVNANVPGPQPPNAK